MILLSALIAELEAVKTQYGDLPCAGGETGLIVVVVSLKDGEPVCSLENT